MSDPDHGRGGGNWFASATAVLLALWVVMAAVIRLGLVRQRGRIAELEKEQAAGEAAAGQARGVKNQVDLVKSFLDQSTSALECWREIAVLQPDGVELTSFAYTAGEGVTLAGAATKADVADDFMNGLEKSQLFAIMADSNAVAAVQAEKDGKQAFRVKLALAGGAR
jgi:hypothetical protein